MSTFQIILISGTLGIFVTAFFVGKRLSTDDDPSMREFGKLSMRIGRTSLILFVIIAIIRIVYNYIGVSGV